MPIEQLSRASSNIVNGDGTDGDSLWLNSTEQCRGRGVQVQHSVRDSGAEEQSAKLERLPEYLRDTVDWFMGKARRKEREGEAVGDPKLYLQEALLERKLPELDMRQLVELPHGLDYNEWLASHTLALFEHVNLLYGAVSEFCSARAPACADMTGPGGRSYAWLDERGKKSRVAAPQYVDYVMTYTQKTVNDEAVFPTKYANEFPPHFGAAVRRVVRLLFHVVAHLYAAHFRELALLRLHAHLHLTFAHLTALDRRFALLDAKETDVLRDLEAALRLGDA
nr:MOB kinase activator-like 2 [Maniola hyperantus]